MEYLRNVGVITFVVLVVIVSIMTLAAEREKDGRTTLTIEETLGAVFMGEVGDHQSPGWTVIASANPEAKSKLYKLLRHDDIAEHHPNILRMLGHIGTEEDVDKLEKWLENTLEGGVDNYEYRAISTFLRYTLPRQYRREIQHARSLLERTATPDYWKERVDSRTIKEAASFFRELPPSAFLTPSLSGYHRSGAENWKEKMRKIRDYVAQLEDGRLKERLEPLGELEFVRKQREQRMKSFMDYEYPPIPDRLRKHLPHMFNGE